MNAKSDDVVIEQLDRMKRMNIHAARGIRDESELDRETYSEEGENGTVVTVIYTEGGVVIVSDRYELEDIAWASHAVDLKIIDDLVEDGYLVHDE